MPSTCGCVLAVIVHIFILFVCCRNKLVLISSDIEREERISFRLLGIGGTKWSYTVEKLVLPVLLDLAQFDCRRNTKDYGR
jgi:hypothetical protein